MKVILDTDTKELLIGSIESKNYDLSKNNLCECINERANKLNQSYNIIKQSNNMRIANLLTLQTSGGRLQIINYDNLIVFLGGVEGRINGYPQVLKNKF